MKKLLLSIFTVTAMLTSASAQQLGNTGFEDWSIDEKWDVNEADVWAPASFCFSFNDVKQCAIYFEQSTDAYSGSYAMKIFAKMDEESSEVGSLPLIQIDSNFSFKPSKMTFWYKSTKPLTAMYYASKPDPENEEEEIEVGVGVAQLSAKSGYTKGEVTIVYPNSEDPEILMVVFSLSDEGLTEGDHFIIDDVELVYDVTGVQNEQVAQLVGGNLVSSELTLSNSVEEIVVMNSTGTDVVTVNNSSKVDFSRMSQGLYFVILKNGSAVQTLKVVKK